LAHPVHVSVRAKAGLLRASTLPALARAIQDHRKPERSFKVAHFFVRDEHLHLVVETRNKAALSLAMRGLLIRIARRLNKLLRRHGRFWADRYDARTLASPEALQAALKAMHHHSAWPSPARRERS
jgi:REP element-mobilizing transposase RayT